MEKNEIRTKFAGIRVATINGEKALHKPLLLLLYLSKYSRGEPRIIPFKDIEDEITNLLKQFGPVRKSYSPELPFWHLKNDGVWDLINVENVENRKNRADPSKKELLDNYVMGGLNNDIYLAIQQDPQLLKDLVQIILDKYIPSQMVGEILKAVGLSKEKIS